MASFASSSSSGSSGKKKKRRRRKKGDETVAVEKGDEVPEEADLRVLKTDEMTKLKPVEEYPEWLFELVDGKDPQAPDWDDPKLQEPQFFKRLVKLERRRLIKENNENRSKK
eukprot:TRINITY_DN1516_c0_g1_i1.p1 TRINITY_DN1516_c0_g1~~TRINITY_DN1516_c0_g1_i1.p1  ORF type:complete len:112 (+),score=30.00 TRINITY_DN1516_c0_g1_i1:466-801(+)